MKKLQEFYEEVLKSDVLKKEFLNCKKEEDFISFLKNNDCDAKVDELKKFIEEKFTKEGKVDTAEVEKVCGGKQSGCRIALDTILTVCSAGIFCGLICIASACLDDGKVGGYLRPNDCVYCHDK